MIARSIAAALLATAMLASAAQAADTTPKEVRTAIRFHYEPAKNMVTVTYFTGCLSAHGGRQIRDDIWIGLDRDYLQFDFQGRYSIDVPAEKPAKRIGNTDCMGAQAKIVELTDIERETYVVNRHGYPDRNVTLDGEEIEFIIEDTDAAHKARKSPAMFLTTE